MSQKLPLASGPMIASDSSRGDRLFPIVTGRSRVPWIWVFLITMPWMNNVVREQISNVGMAFTLKKFVENPALIGGILSTNMAFSMTVAAIVAYASDHIWTRWGRRRPFVLIALLGPAVIGLCIPGLNSFVAVAVAIVLFQLLADLMASFEPMVNEVVPPKQRGRNGAITSGYKAIGMMIVLNFLIGGFDNDYEIAGIAVTGEFVMYFGLACMSMTCFYLIAFHVKETPPKEKPMGWKSLKPSRFFKQVLSKQFLPLFGLMFVLQNLWSSLGPYEALLITEQWGVPKQQYGQIMSLSFLIGLPLLPIAGWFSDRYDRLEILKYGLIFVLISKSGFYLYTDLVLGGQTPHVGWIYFYGILKSSISTFLSVSCIPLIFDYVRRSELGTLGCGISLVLGGVSFVGVNVSGAWITVSSGFLYQYPKGEYNYLSGFHYLIFTGLLGLAYLFVFKNWTQSGKLVKKGREEAEIDAANESI